MTCSTTNHLVEHVARAICQARGIDPDEVSFASDGTTGATTISERRLDRQKASANAAIRATLEYVRDNVSERMLAAAVPLADGDPPDDAKRLAAGALLLLSGARDFPNEGEVVPHAAQIVVDFRAMISSLLADIDTKGRGDVSDNPPYPPPITYPAEYDVIPRLRQIQDLLEPNDCHLLGSAILEIIELRERLAPDSRIEGAVRKLRALKRDFNMKGANATTMERAIDLIHSFARPSTAHEEGKTGS